MSKCAIYQFGDRSTRRCVWCHRPADTEGNQRECTVQPRRYSGRDKAILSGASTNLWLALGNILKALKMDHKPFYNPKWGEGATIINFQNEAPTITPQEWKVIYGEIRSAQTTWWAWKEGVESIGMNMKNAEGETAPLDLTDDPPPEPPPPDPCLRFRTLDLD